MIVVEIEIKLKQLLKERKIKQYQLAEMSGLTTRTISELCNNKMERVPLNVLSKIAEVLEIEDILEIIDFRKE